MAVAPFIAPRGDTWRVARFAPGLLQSQSLATAIAETPQAMDALRERKRKLTEELKTVRAQRTTARKTAAKESLQWSLRGGEHNVAMCIYIMTDCSLEPTTLYLKQVAGKHGWPDKSDGEIHVLIMETFAAASTDLLLTLVMEDCCDTLADRREARKHVLGWCVAEWTRAQNTKDPDPVEPSTSEMLDQLELIRLSMPENERPPPWGVVASASARQKACRLRAKYGGRIGKLRTQAHVPTAELRAKTVAAWQWCNHLTSKVPKNKRILRVNLDETAICMFPGSRGGNLFISKEEEPTLNVKHATKRTYLTHVAIVCDDAEVQKVLPQVFIGNEHTIPAGLLKELRSSCPANVTILRKKSAWLNTDVFVEIIKLIKDALAPYKDVFQVLLLFDTCSAHTHVRSFNACSRAGIWPHLVPPSLTWFLQPLDTEGFAVYKLRIQREFQDARTRQVIAIGDVAALLPCIYIAIETVLNSKNWAAAFDRNGFSLGQLGVKIDKLRAMDACALAVPCERPVLEQLSLCFPRRRKIVPAAIWRGADAKAPVATVACAASSSSSSAVLAVPPAAIAPIAHRTRSKAKAPPPP